MNACVASKGSGQPIWPYNSRPPLSAYKDSKLFTDQTPVAQLHWKDAQTDLHLKWKTKFLSKNSSFYIPCDYIQVKQFFIPENTKDHLHLGSQISSYCTYRAREALLGGWHMNFLVSIAVDIIFYMLISEWCHFTYIIWLG